MPTVQIMTARVIDDEGTELAWVERVRIGGGTRVIEGEEHQHPTFERHHVRLLSPDRMIPDQLLEVESYDEAIALAEEYGARREEHATEVAQLGQRLRMS